MFCLINLTNKNILTEKGRIFFVVTKNNKKNEKSYRSTLSGGKFKPSK